MSMVTCDMCLHIKAILHKMASKEHFKIQSIFYDHKTSRAIIPTATRKRARSGLPKPLKRDAQWSLWSPQKHPLSVLPVSGFFPRKPIEILTPSSWLVEAQRAALHLLSAWGCVQQWWRSDSRPNSSRPDRPRHQGGNLFPNASSLQSSTCSLKSSPHWNFVVQPDRTVKKEDWRRLWFR